MGYKAIDHLEQGWIDIKEIPVPKDKRVQLASINPGVKEDVRKRIMWRSTGKLIKDDKYTIAQGKYDLGKIINNKVTHWKDL